MYLSEATRAELSVQLGLTSRQLQMWFYHRQLKDSKAPSEKRQKKDSASLAHVVGIAGEGMKAGEAGNEHGSSGSSMFSHELELRRGVPRPGMAVPRYHEVPHSMAELELRAIAFVELQLGASPAVQQKQPGQPFETKIYERLATKAVKAVHEYQFLLEQPTVKTETHERVAPSYYYGSPRDGPDARVSSSYAGHSSAHGNEEVPSGYRFPSQMPNLNLLPQQSGQEHPLPTASREYDNVSRKNSLPNVALAANIGAHPIPALEIPFLTSDRRVSLYEDVFRMERKRKAERMRQKEELRKEKEASRIKVANERAIARKLAKELMELIEDERLELMELAASSKGLPSTLSLDFEILQNLDAFRDNLCVPAQDSAIEEIFLNPTMEGF
ncbi:hypothetical protein CCACVL1_31069 [Corchorus capsularis]|uniref:Homeobox domain-containing protein n=1 Tax=Corchorus capsularis TaxID=210143 RepID=A0A1R3FUC2_COCAP|nr:hypothetical protein CCACVL1_31069 [Corchorus capsularis]